MEKKIEKMIDGMFASNTFPTRFLIVYLLLVMLCNLLSLPMTEKIAAIQIRDLHLDGVQNEIAQAMIDRMGTITIISSVIGCMIDVFVCSLFIYIATKIIKIDVKFSKCVLMYLLVSLIILVNEYIVLGINNMIGIENINTMKDMYCTSFANILNIPGNTFFYKMMLILNPLRLLAFAFFVYCMKIVTKSNTIKVVNISLGLICLYVIFNTLLLNITM
jgi:hypothetical protein